MPRPMTRVLAAAALAVPVLTGLSAVSASACEPVPAETTTVTEPTTVEPTVTDETVVTEETVTETAPEGPVLFEAAYTRW